MKYKGKWIDQYMNEVIFYGGIPMTRTDVYRQAYKDTGSRKAADTFAFAPHKRKAPKGVRPVSLREFNRITSQEKSRGIKITPNRPRIPR
jgi:hypothetical protein